MVREHATLCVGPMPCSAAAQFRRGKSNARNDGRGVRSVSPLSRDRPPDRHSSDTITFIRWRDGTPGSIDPQRVNKYAIVRDVHYCAAAAVVDYALSLIGPVSK